MKLLLHTCCGPCLLPVARKLQAGVELAAYFYNPNIHPRTEHELRLQAFHTAAQTLGLPTLPEPRYEPQTFFRAVTFREEERCRLCYRVRLFETALAARDAGIEAFTTTLLISPHQDQKLIREVAEAAAEAVEVQFHFEDFRPLFPQVRGLAEPLGLYRQKYCGCLYSEIEAESSRRARRGLPAAGGQASPDGRGKACLAPTLRGPRRRERRRAGA
jgi:predicted adenine nucleotide alpha hydrolase (AANH) superfamily ATPase